MPQVTVVLAGSGLVTVNVTAPPPVMLVRLAVIPTALFCLHWAYTVKSPFTTVSVVNPEPVPDSSVFQPMKV